MTTRLYDGTSQGMFDTVVRHLFTQGRPALAGPGSTIHSSNGCMYRGHAGTKCAAGVLIPDDKYHPDMENRPSYAAVVQEAIGVTGHEQSTLLTALQQTHDNENVLNSDATFNRELLAKRLRQVAASFGLSDAAIPAA